MATRTSAVAAGTKTAAPAKSEKEEQSLFEEDDEFEEFPAEGGACC